MGSEGDTKRSHVGQVAGLVSSLGRVVKKRVGEFVAEADEELRTKLDEAQHELQEELDDVAGEPPKEP